MTPPVLSLGKGWLLAGLVSCLLCLPGSPSLGEEEEILPALAALEPVLLLPAEELAVVRSGAGDGEGTGGLKVLRVGDPLLEGQAFVERIEDERLVFQVPAADGGLQVWLEAGAAPGARLRVVRRRGPSGGGGAIVAVRPPVEAEDQPREPLADTGPDDPTAIEEGSAISYPGVEPGQREPESRAGAATGSEEDPEPEGGQP